MLTIRHARPEDAPRLQHLQQGIYDEGRFFVGDGAVSSHHLQQYLRHLRSKQQLYLLAIESQALAGYLELTRLRSRKLSHTALLTIALAPDYRGQGIGRQLLQRSYSWCAQVGVHRIELEVRANNRPAIALYLQEGFEQEGCKRKAVRLAEDRYEDSLLMAKWLEPIS